MLTAKITQKEFVQQIEARILGLIEEIGIEPDKKLRKRLGKKAKKLGQKLYEKMAKKFSETEIPPVGEQVTDKIAAATTMAVSVENSKSAPTESAATAAKSKRAANGQFKKQ